MRRQTPFHLMLVAGVCLVLLSMSLAGAAVQMECESGTSTTLEPDSHPVVGTVPQAKTPGTVRRDCSPKAIVPQEKVPMPVPGSAMPCWRKEWST
jgi:hypothetical protein